MFPNLNKAFFNIFDVLKDYPSYTREQLIEELRKTKKMKKYGLIWDEEKVKEVFEEEVEKKLPVLTEVKSKQIKTNPTNILIEGDNYHALAVLSYTHKGKIDVIYIDPPYNTGHEDFKYNDVWVNTEDSYKHSKWLSFMEKRLRLAKTLLSKNGVVFISIDDIEYAQLKLLCDEIFKETNFIANIIWQSKTGSSDAKTIDTVTEYILVYAKNKQHASFLKNIGAHKVERFRSKDRHIHERGAYYPDTLDRGGLRYSNSLNFPIMCPDGKITYPNGRTKFKKDGWTWKWGKEKVQWGIENDFIVFRKSERKESGWTVSYKNYLLVDNAGNKIKRSLPYRNIITEIKTGDGAKRIKELFGHQVFKYTKPVELIMMLLKMVKISFDGIILDFMAGTGTTGEAVLKLNSEQNISYRFILCTNNENNICTEICYPRLKKVIQGYANSKGNKVAGLGGGVKYFRTAFVDSAPTDANKKKIVDRSTEMLCLKEGCFDEVKTTKNYVIFRGNEKILVIVYSDEGVEPARKVIAKMGKSCIVYVFSLDEYDKAEEFEGVKHLVKLKSIPVDILNLYRRLFG